MIQENYKLNSTAVPTWKHLRVNDFNLDNFTKSKIEKYNKNYLSFNVEDFKDIVVIPTKDAEKAEENYFNYINIEEKYGVSDKFIKLGENEFNSGVFAHVLKNKIINSPIKLSYKLDGENPTVVDHNIIVAEEGCKVTLIFDYSNEAAVNAFHNGVTKVFAEDNSEITIIKIQRMKDDAIHLDSNIAFLSRKAKVNWVTVELGAGINVTNYTSNLNGNSSSADIYSAYFVDGERKQDLYYTANHIGMRSQRNFNMIIKGVLKDRSKKLFKGNIDFKKGSSKSKGKQEETVLLLDPTVKTDSVPMLLCHEEDVEGTHAASVGRVNGEKLFYLMSRGFSEEEAKRLVIEGEFSPILDKIEDGALRSLLKAEIKRRLSNE